MAGHSLHLVQEARQPFVDSLFFFFFLSEHAGSFAGWQTGRRRDWGKNVDLEFG